MGSYLIVCLFVCLIDRRVCFCVWACVGVCVYLLVCEFDGLLCLFAGLLVLTFVCVCLLD